MIGAIPNPTRELTVPFANNQVQSALSNLSKYMIGSGAGAYNQENYDNVIGQVELTKTEFLSAGVSIVVAAHAVSDAQTKVNIEVRRRIGSFDEWYEVSKAKDHIDTVVKSLSTLLANPTAADNISVEQVETAKAESSNSHVTGFVVFALFVAAYLLVVAS